MPSTLRAEPLPVLVVDDDSALIRTLADILKMHGYAPTTAETGQAGLALAADRAPALAVVDLRLPDMDGMELAAKLHALSELTEVVVLTGNASVESAVAALREHSVDYLLKPVQIDKLLQVMSVAGERWQRRHAEELLRESDERFRRALEERVRQQAAVARLGRRALIADQPAGLLDDAVTLVSETLGVPYSCILERKADGTALVFRTCVGWRNVEIGVTTVPLVDTTQAGFSLRSNQEVLVTDLAAETRFPESAVLRDFGIASGISVPIPGRAHPFGVLEAHDRQARRFSEDDVHFLTAIAHILGTALERAKTEAAFRHSQRLEAVGRLASGVAHDFNNMLSAITAYGELLKAGLENNPTLQDDAEEILKAAAKAAGLTKQLLAFSRQQMLQPRVVGLNDIVVDMEKMVRRLVGSNIEVSMNLAADLDPVKADPGQLEQVILNLCVNARDAMPDGGRLTIETGNIELDGSESHDPAESTAGAHVMLAVCDSGVGMDAETKSRIFEPFFTTKPPEQGTGLGLATVYGIVKQSGGDIWVYSEVGRGTTFRVFLPRAAEAAAAAVPVAPRPSPIHARPSATILLAEDEEPIRRVAQRVLEREGYVVLVASNALEADRILQEHAGKIDLLVTDMVMPHGSGRDLADRAREHDPDVRVLFLSGYTESILLRQGLLERGELLLQKPFAAGTLTTRIREALAQR